MVTIILSAPVLVAAQDDDLWKAVVRAGGSQTDQQSTQVLTNDSIVKLTKAGLGEDTITTMIDAKPGNYSLRTDDIISLKRQGVSEKTITAMLNKLADTVTLGPAPAEPTPRVVKSEAQTRQPENGVPEIPNQAGLYAVVSSVGLEHIVGRVTSFERSGSVLASAVTCGIHATRVNTQIPGEHARESQCSLSFSQVTFEDRASRQSCARLAPYVKMVRDHPVQAGPHRIDCIWASFFGYGALCRVQLSGCRKSASF